ncbi:hypothetical protein ACR77J_16295 [Tissierella praeacuta]|uniref:hypothetical protein n=1 Tax=Tissierella praeacuta TaxID=43131 RepID=UPI0028B0DA7C|nr:hypothetical protein [Tissierella praeacuta]
MEYIITTNEDADIKIGIEGVEDILQCGRMILGIIEGTVFLDRELGISSEVIDEPLNRIDRLYEEIYRKIEGYEPRLKVTSIKTKTDNLKGKINLIVGVKINEEYL